MYKYKMFYVIDFVFEVVICKDTDYVERRNISISGLSFSKGG